MWWRRPSDPLRSAFIAAGKRLPILFDLYLRATAGWRGDRATMVYSDGHSGTSSLSMSLDRWGARPVFHVHILCPTNIDTQPHYPRGVGWIYYKSLVERPHPLKVISMVRNPVDRWISGFFHSRFDHHRRAPDVPTCDLVRDFEDFVDRHHGRDWFETELRPGLGIDVYAEPFPASQGFQILSRDPVELLVLRLELDDVLKERTVAGFVGLDAFRWERVGQVARAKGYADLYRRFRDEARLSTQTLDHLLETRFARHFYTEAERDRSRRRWALAVAAEDTGRA